MAVCPCPEEGPGGVLPPNALAAPNDWQETAGRGRHGQVMWVSQGGLPIGLTIGGYHHGTTEKAGNPHRARRWEIVALSARRDV